MSAKYLTLLTSTLLLLYSCGTKNVDSDVKHAYPSDINMSLRVAGTAGYASEDTDNQINAINVYSFSKKPGEAAYTFEKSYLNIVPVVNGAKTEVSLSFDGSLPRILYLVANDVSKITFLKTLLPTTTSTEMDEKAIIANPNISRSPLTLVSKVALTTPSPQTNITVEFTHTLSRLDIVNNYVGFTIDSMIVRNAVLGTSAFIETPSSLAPFGRGEVKYTESPIYIYQTDMSQLSIYGKYNNIRAVFDIDLKNINKATRYNVKFRSINDHETNISSNLIWSVTPWALGDTINTTPDWNK